MIDEQLAAFLQEGVGIHIGTRNDALEPNGARAIAVKVEDDGMHLVVYVARRRGGARAAGSRGQRPGRGRIRPPDRRPRLPGEGRSFVGARAATDGRTRRSCWRSGTAFSDSLEQIGIPRVAHDGVGDVAGRRDPR